MNQRRIPADNADVVHKNMSLDSLNLHTRMIWGMLEKVCKQGRKNPVGSGLVIIHFSFYKPYFYIKATAMIELVILNRFLISHPFIDILPQDR